jgi:hypothetical protein
VLFREPKVVLASTSAIINLPRTHSNDAQLIARGPKRVEKLLLRRRLILRRMANRFGSTYVGVPGGAKLEEIREKSHWIFRLFPTDRSNRAADRLRRFGNIFRGLDGAGIDHKGLVRSGAVGFWFQPIFRLSPSTSESGG